MKKTSTMTQTTEEIEMNKETVAELKATAKKDMIAAEAKLREALALIRKAKAGFEFSAKISKKWNVPIEELGYYGRQVAEILSSDEGQAGFHQLTK